MKQHCGWNDDTETFAIPRPGCPAAAGSGTSGANGAAAPYAAHVLGEGRFGAHPGATAGAGRAKGQERGAAMAEGAAAGGTVAGEAHASRTRAREQLDDEVKEALQQAGSAKMKDKAGRGVDDEQAAEKEGGVDEEEEDVATDNANENKGAEVASGALGARDTLATASMDGSSTSAFVSAAKRGADGALRG